MEKQSTIAKLVDVKKNHVPLLKRAAKRRGFNTLKPFLERLISEEATKEKKNEPTE